MNNKEWSIFRGTLAGYFLELRLLSELVKLVAVEVAFGGGRAVRMVRELETVPE